MIIDTDVVTLSRLQFALTALYHFLFVPLTLGLVWMLAIMESVYVMTGREVWKRMVQFWGVLFGINFAMGVATGVTMEFQFGMNWAYYSHYVGDIFGAPLAIEGLMAFFLEATLVGVFFMGWDRISRIKHLLVTWFLALGTSLSALWILIANAWMQHPVGASFNPQTMRMEVTSFADVLFNPVAQDEVRAHGKRRLRDRLDVRAFHQRLVPAARSQRGFRQALDDGGGELRPGRRLVGGGARRRLRLHGVAQPENEDGRDRGHVAYRAGAGLVHRCSAFPTWSSGPPTSRSRSRGSWG